MNLVKVTFRQVFQIEKDKQTFDQVDENGYPIACSANFLCQVINQLPLAKLYLKTNVEYFWLLQILLKLDEKIIFYLLRREFVGRLACYGLDQSESNITLEDAQSLVEPLLFREHSIGIEYNSFLSKELLKPKEYSLLTPSMCDLTAYFKLLWNLLSWSMMPEVPNYSESIYHKTSTENEYTLSLLEVKFLNLNQKKIESLFISIGLKNIRARVSVCKILACLCYESIDNTKKIINYIKEELDFDKANKRADEYFKLIQAVVKINDKFQKMRVLTT